MKFIKTLERIDPETSTFIHKGTLLQHLERYKFSLGFCKDKVVLDAACGTGYGSNILAKSAKSVLGIDISKNTITENIKNFSDAKNLKFEVMDVSKISIPDNSIDVIVSFETIEHLKEDKINSMLNEFHRVLKKEGMLIVSTPDVRNYSLNYFIHSNGYHLTEFNFMEFKNILSKKFHIIEEYYQDQSLQPLRKFLTALMVNRFFAVFFQKIWRGIKSVFFYEVEVKKYTEDLKQNTIPMYNILVLKK